MARPEARRSGCFLGFLFLRAASAYDAAVAATLLDGWNAGALVAVVAAEAGTWVGAASAAPSRAETKSRATTPHGHLE